MGGKEELEKIKRFLGAYQHMIADRDFMLSRRPDGFWCSNPAHEVNTNYRYWNGYSFDCQCAYIPTGEIACDPSANQGSCVDTGPFTTKTIDFGIQDLWFNHSKAKKWYAIEYICEADDEWCHGNHTHTLLDTLNNYIHGDPNPWEKETEISKPGEVFDLDWVTNFIQDLEMLDMTNQMIWKHILKIVSEDQLIYHNVIMKINQMIILFVMLSMNQKLKENIPKLEV